ncbi:sn-glycerol-3-phosphate ABC transporter ATP-binding protein UgpC [Mesorhizobium sp. LHD-90]|uniref:ABC transporter ATP-binding protein n=1 Tax=Mesorhizobium sp. LHD-90 TaxID=3071414 RepID=UPI0027DEF1C7|nr:sn-glycerol-3-phosphate ABC transporter ATP-binding protein UgpC [Mesorhizobium sp. LHD-90]MDQ6438183.1 sn-glycerol-3-phosphate ABC transporter ATP-binding protein UgpC [Mesorhizobium sp. LHD-90]
MSSVAIKNVVKSYGALQILNGIDIEIEDNSFVVLLGPSGCGKSTLLRMIAGLEDLTSGDIMIGGKTVNNLHPKARDIAMVFQNYALYPHMNVFDNMGFSLRLAGTDKEIIRKKVHEAAQILDLHQYLDRYPRQLSGGQRQRVAMGRAIVRDPKVFLFDEPLSNLDAKLRVQMRTEIKSLHQRLNATCIYVTHDQIEAMTMADKIVVMRSGNIEQFGSPLDIFDNPNNIFVAGFIGSPPMNLIECSVAAANGSIRLITKDGIELPWRGDAHITDGQRVVYGVRPGNLKLVESGGIATRIDVQEQTGSETLVFGLAGTSNICATFSERHNFQRGQQIRLEPEPVNVHLFDGDSGVRIAKSSSAAT